MPESCSQEGGSLKPDKGQVGIWKGDISTRLREEELCPHPGQCPFHWLVPWEQCPDTDREKLQEEVSVGVD